MKILFFGRGAIGTQYAWAFEKAGHQVEFYVRKGRKEQFGSYVDLQISDGRRKKDKQIREKWPVTLLEEEELTTSYDLIFLSVNPQQIRNAIEFLAPQIGDATLLCFNNCGLTPEETIYPIPREQVVFGFPGAGGGFEGNSLYGILYKEVQLGIENVVPSDRESKVKSLFETTGFQVNLQKDIAGWLLNHYVANAAMEAEVLKHGSFQDVVSSTEALTDMLRNVKEMIPYVKAKGYRPDVIAIATQVLPVRLIGFLLNHLFYAPGGAAYEAIIHNHFQVGYAVEDVIRDADALGISLERMKAAKNSDASAPE